MRGVKINIQLATMKLPTQKRLIARTQQKNHLNRIIGQVDFNTFKLDLHSGDQFARTELRLFQDPR